MNDKILSIVIKAKDEATKTLNGLSNTLKNNEKSFQNMALAGTVALGAVTGVVLTSVNAYAESERSQRQLEHAIMSVSKGTANQVKQVNELTMALQKKAGIDGDALNAGVAQLSTFGLQSESVVALTKSLADLTVNQSGVTAGADQYISSANIMAKALNGQFGALEKMGIRFTDTQQKLIQFGSETQRVKAIQEGFAQNLRETTDTVKGYDVEMGKLRQQFGEIQEMVGKSLQPVLTELANRLVPILDTVTSWIEKNPNLTTGLLLLTGALGGLSVVLGTIGLAIPAIIAGFGLLSFPVIGIGLAIGGVVLIMKNLWDITQEVYLISEDVILGLKTYWGDFLAFLKKIWDTFKVGWKETWNMISDTVKTASTAIVGFFQPFVDTVKSAYDWVVRLLDKMKELGGGAVGSVMSFFGKGRATGGGVQTGQSYMVGEKGPEMFTPASNGSITSNNRLGSSGGQTVIINMNGGTYLSETVAEQIGDKIIQRFKKVVKF